MIIESFFILLPPNALFKLINEVFSDCDLVVAGDCVVFGIVVISKVSICLLLIKYKIINIIIITTIQATPYI